MLICLKEVKTYLAAMHKAIDHNIIIHDRKKYLVYDLIGS